MASSRFRLRHHRCPCCGSAWLLARQVRGVGPLVQRLTTRRPYSCECGWRGWLAQSADGVLTAAVPRRQNAPIALREEGDGAAADASPFSLFVSENAVDDTPENVAEPPPPKAPAGFPVFFQSPLRPAAYDARWTIGAFGWGLVGGAASLWVLTYSPSRTIDTPSSPAIASVDTPSSSGAPMPDIVSATVASTAASRPAGPAVAAPAAVRRQTTSTAASRSPARTTDSVQPVAQRRPAPAVAASVAPALRQSTNRPVQFRGTLAVDSTPSKAQVIIDGTPVGVTPMVLERLPAGSHVLRLELDGHRVSSSAVRVVANQRTRIAIALEADRNR
jgi:hypothetical protein